LRVGARVCVRSVVLQGVVALFPGPHADHVLDVVHEDLAVSDVAGSERLLDGLDHGVRERLAGNNSGLKIYLEFHIKTLKIQRFNGMMNIKTASEQPVKLHEMNDRGGSAIMKIAKLLRDGEGLTIEFKRCHDKLSHTVYETVCSFSNRYGGDMLLGVEDDGAVTGVARAAVKQLKKDFANALNNPQIFNPTLFVELDEVEIDGKIVLHCHIPLRRNPKTR
jgi:hypothetical protein